VTYYPYTFRDAEHLLAYTKSDVFKELTKGYEDKTGHRIVAVTYYGVRHTSSNKPIKTCADMKGLKIRVQTSAVMAEVMQALGATPIAVPYAQVHQRFAAGTIDAAENNLVSYFASRHHEVAKVYSLTEHASPPAVVVFSRRVWDKLPAEDQRIIRQAARESVPRFRKLVEEHEAAARSALAAEGVQFVTDIDKAAFVRVLAPLYPKLVTAPRHRDLIDQVRAGE
jgi:TRAP-type C4-dicarboxylate transport system substrate-binding protein